MIVVCARDHGENNENSHTLKRERLRIDARTITEEA